MISYAEIEQSVRYEASKDCAAFGLLICGVCPLCKAAKEQSRREEEAMRDAFEDWYSGGCEHPLAVERDGEGYKLLAADNAWRAWSAAWEARGNE